MIQGIIGIAFDCPDANALADFYVLMSGWKKELSTEELALKHGATKSSVQFFETSTVMLDPAGHPFCLSTVSQ